MRIARPRLVGLVVALVVVEFCAYAALRLSARILGEPIQRRAAIYETQSASMRQLVDDQSSNPLRIDSALGWRSRANYRRGPNILNARALRSEREFSPQADVGTVRIAAFGDSFVYGSEVENGEEWAAVLTDEYPNVEVLNYGVAGYGVDQAYLRYLEEGAALRPHIVLIGFVPDDMSRLVNAFRPFRSPRQVAMFKPRFVLDAAGGLRLVPNPAPSVAAYHRYLADPAAVREIGRHDYWYEPLVYENPLYDWSTTIRLASHVPIVLRRRVLDPKRPLKAGRLNPDSDAFKIQAKLFEQFAGAVVANGARPVVVFFPDRMSIDAMRAGQPTPYEPLLQVVRASKTFALDALDAFREDSAAIAGAQLFMEQGHYTAHSNRVVAQWLQRALLDSKPAAQ